MDDLQTTEDGFNFNAYGFVVRLLHADIPVYWAIAAGKEKDEADFSALASEIWPTNGTAEEYCYAGGPFIIRSCSSDAALDLLASLPESYQDVVVHILEEDAEVDIRYELRHKPRVLVSDLGGYGDLHVELLEGAGLEEETHYSVASTTEELADDLSCDCYTIVTEPHYDDDCSLPEYYFAVEEFVMSGGNFLAMSSAIKTFENFDDEDNSTETGFLTYDGIYDFPTCTDEFDYPNADLPFGQFIGGLSNNYPDVTYGFCVNSGDEGCDDEPEEEDCEEDGEDYYYDEEEEAGDLFINNGYVQVMNGPDAELCDNGEAAIIASVAKLETDNTYGIGGLVFYLAGPDWDNSEICLDTALRMYFNALLMPAYPADGCELSFCPDGETCLSSLSCLTCTCVNNQAQYTAIEGCCDSECDCPEGEICIDGACGEPECECDDECDYFEECVEGQCVFVEECCEVDSDCGEGVCFQCCDGVCSHIEGCCSSDDDCPLDSVCEDNACVQTCCESDDDCGANEVCSDGACIPLDCCYSDEDCGYDASNPCVMCNTTTGTCGIKDDCCIASSNCSTCYECVYNSCQRVGSCCLRDEECAPECTCVESLCSCPKGDGGLGGDGSITGDGDGSQTAAIVGGTIGGLVGLAALAGVAAVLAAAAFMLIRYLKAGNVPQGIGQSLANPFDAESHVNPLHTAQEQSVLNPLYSDI